MLKSCHTVGDGGGGEADATSKRITSDTCHAVGDIDGGEAGALTERTLSNACHTAGNGTQKGRFLLCTFCA